MFLPAMRDSAMRDGGTLKAIASGTHPPMKLYDCSTGVNANLDAHPLLRARFQSFAGIG